MTLNNLANLQKKLNQNQEALKNYNKALKLYRELAKKNPDAFNYYVATTLNNLAILQEKLNQNQEALKNFKESLEIRKDLAKKNPKVFGIDYVQSLVMGVDLFNQPKADLEKAKKILLNFRGVPKAKWLLGVIEELKKVAP
jgi:tetratricopeptide (TPR) repeat protein